MAGSKGAPRPRSTRYRRFSLAVLGCPSRKFSGLTSPCTYLRAPRAAGHDARPSRPRPPPHPAAHRQEAGRRARRAGAAHPLRCSFSRMDSASTAMQDTISCDITCPCEFHTSQRLGPSMSITCARARARARPLRRPGRRRARAASPARPPPAPAHAYGRARPSQRCAIAAPRWAAARLSPAPAVRVCAGVLQDSRDPGSARLAAPTVSASAQARRQLRRTGGHAGAGTARSGGRGTPSRSSRPAAPCSARAGCRGCSPASYCVGYARSRRQTRCSPSVPPNAKALTRPCSPYLADLEERSRATKHRHNEPAGTGSPACTAHRTHPGLQGFHTRDTHAGTRVFSGQERRQARSPWRPYLTLAGPRADLYTDHSYGGP